MHALICSLVLLGATDEPFAEWVSEVTDRAELPESVGVRLTSAELEALAQAEPTTPFAELTAGLRLEDGSLWVGSSGGLMYLAPGADRWRLFHSRRWLPDDRVLDLAVAEDGSLWVRTKAGIGRLVEREWTLDQKMAQIHAMLRKHHLREGLVGQVALDEPGTLEAGYTQHTSDNDGLWTSLYVAAEAFRYGATGDPEARQNAWQSLQALMFLEKVTGIPGFVARSFLPGEGPNPGERYGGEWHRSADGKWWWKGDTSSDEVDGHYFAYAVYYNVAATEEQKRAIRQVVARITDHILDHGYYLVGPPGKPTTWGVWAPESLNHNLKWIAERGLNSLEILSHLKVAAHITGSPRYAEAARRLIDDHAYAMNTVRQKILWPEEGVNHSDDELAFLAYYPLLWHERDAELRKFYLASLERSWQIERPEQSPLFNYIYATGRQASRWPHPSRRPPAGLVDGVEYDAQASLAWFRDVPADTIDWTVRNSGRRDVGPVVENRFGRLRGATVFPIYERLLLRWNADPYQLDTGGGGRRRNDGAFILLPYWMGKYHRLMP
jgi:hypothetical protein